MQATATPRGPGQVRSLIALLLLQWLIVPMSLALADAGLPATPILISWSLLLAIVAIGLGLLQRIASWLATTFAFLLGVYGSVCAVLALYRVATSTWVDLSFLLAMPRDTAKTGWLWLGGVGLAVAASVFLAHAAAQAWAARALGGAIATTRATTLQSSVVLLLLVPALIWFGLPHPKLLLDTDMAKRAAHVKPLLPSAALSVNAGESLFLVQLESLNGVAVNGDYPARPASDPIPVLRTLATQNGIFFPALWSSDVQTHRVSQTILCGAVRNVNASTFFEQTVFRSDCIPALFRNAGYRTIYLSGYPDGDFARTRELMHRAGYTDVHFADFMQPGDERHLWGYEESLFFRRAFTYLRKHYRGDERLLVHFAVSAHHVGFSRRLEGEKEWFFAPREQQLASYFASAQKQDAALATFWDEYRRFTGANAHLFIFGDHSYPLGLYGSVQPDRGATIDNFVTTMAYLPPQQRNSEFAIGRSIPDLFAQADLPPTLAELVSGRPQPNSLVPFLRREPAARAPYERCQVMVQPFGYRAVAIARGDSLHVYSFADECVETFRLTHSPLRQERVARDCDLAFGEYERRYGCARYRREIRAASAR
jgi:hypothetical protein